jgi:hypothetical protein
MTQPIRSLKVQENGADTPELVTNGINGELPLVEIQTEQGRFTVRTNRDGSLAITFRGASMDRDRLAVMPDSSKSIRLAATDDY